MRVRSVYLVVVLSLLLSGCSSDKNSTSPDTRAPAVVNDLAISAVTDSSVSLRWTAPGDDGDFGTAAAYDMRVANSAMNLEDWDTYAQADGAPVPASAGSPDSMEATVLASIPGWNDPAVERLSWSFALRTVDESGNWSGMSNLVSTDLLDSTPPAMIGDLMLMAFTDSSLSLEWTAPGDDGHGGRATAYDVRYATEPITEGSWAQAMEVPNPPVPQLVFATESIEIVGLTSGTTYFVGIKTVDERENWSELSNVLSATPFLDEVVSIPDPSLEAGLRSLLGISSGDIMASDMLTLESINFQAAGISDITGLEVCFNLRSLYLDDNTISSLAPLADLTILEDLRLDNNAIIDVSPLANLSNLKFLKLSQNNVADISSLSSLASLQELSMWKNALTNISGVSGMAALEFLDLTDNLISTLPPMDALTKLRMLWISTNSLVDISSVADLPALEDLSIGLNTVTNLSPLTTLTQLKVITMNGNGISDIQPMSGLVNLERLTAHDNSISNLTPLAASTKMERLWLYRNAIIDIAPLAGMTEMQQLSLFANEIADLSPLAGMTKMARLIVYQNPFSSIGALSNMADLQEAWVGWSDLADLTPLQNLAGLSKLVIDRSQVEDLSPLAELTEMRELFCWDTPVEDISAVEGMVDLTVLFLSSTLVVDLEPAVNNLGFAAGDVLWIEDCGSLSMESLDTHVPALEARGVTVNQ